MTPVTENKTGHGLLERVSTSNIVALAYLRRLCSLGTLARDVSPWNAGEAIAATTAILTLGRPVANLVVLYYLRAKQKAPPAKGKK